MPYILTVFDRSHTDYQFVFSINKQSAGIPVFFRPYHQFCHIIVLLKCDLAEHFLFTCFFACEFLFFYFYYSGGNSGFASILVVAQCIFKSRIGCTSANLFFDFTVVINSLLVNRSKTRYFDLLLRPEIMLPYQVFRKILRLNFKTESLSCFFYNCISFHYRQSIFNMVKTTGKN